jgi:hypothetical protein
MITPEAVAVPGPGLYNVVSREYKKRAPVFPAKPVTKRARRLPVCVAHGVDTFWIRLEVDLHEEARAQVENARLMTRAGDRRRVDVGVIRFAIERECVRHGQQYFPVALKNGRFGVVGILPSKSEDSPSIVLIKFDCRSLWTTPGGALTLWRVARKWISQIAHVKSAEVVKLALTADFIGLHPLDRDRARFVGNGARHVESFHDRGRFTGFEFGAKQGIRATIYDKTLEIVKSGKEWMHEVWDPSAKDHAVWRVEPVFNAGALKTRPFLRSTDPESVLGSLRALWIDATGSADHGGWLRLARKTRDPNRARWPVSRAWERVQRAWPEDGRTMTVLPPMPRTLDTRRLVGVLCGYAKSVAASSAWTGDFDADWKAIGAIVLDRAGGPEGWRADVQSRATDLGVKLAGR